MNIEIELLKKQNINNKYYKLLQKINYLNYYDEYTSIIKFDKKLFENSTLPKEVINTFYIRIIEDLEKIIISYSYGTSLPEQEDWLIIGYHYLGDYLCINLKTEEIKLFSYELGNYEININNSIEQFFNTIILFKRFLIKRIHIFKSSYNINKKIKNLKNQINTLKSNLLKINNIKENYWLKKVETMENEILFWKKFLLYDNYLIQEILEKTYFLEISSNKLKTTS